MSLQDQLNKGSNTLSDTAKNDLYKNIEYKKKNLQREVEDAQADLEADQQKLLQQLGQKILAVIEKYSRDNGITMVLDVSSRRRLYCTRRPASISRKRSSRCTTRTRVAAGAPGPATSAPKAPATAAPKPPAAKPAGQ